MMAAHSYIKSPSSVALRRLIWTAVSLSLVVCVMISGLHYHHKITLQNITKRLEDTRKTRIELSQGFLYTSLDNRPDSPFDRAQGFALLEQAVRSFSESLTGLEETPEISISAFRQSVNEFQEKLAAWSSSEALTPSQAVTLRITYGQLEREAARIDHLIQEHLHTLTRRFDIEFGIAVALALLLVGAFSMLFFRMLRAEEMANAAFQKSEARFQSLVQYAPVPMCLATQEKKFVYLNDRFTKIFGYKQSDIPTVDAWFTLAYPDEPYRNWVVNTWNKAVEKAIATREDIEPIEYRVTCKDGSVRVMEISGIFLGREIVAIFIDLTERKQAEADRERLIAAIEQAAEMVCITDPDGAIQYVNPAFERITGYSPDEAVGKNPRFLKSDQQDDGFYHELWRTITGGNAWEGRIVNRRKDAVLYTEEAVISPVRDSTGKIVNFVAVARDISRDLALEEQIRQSQKLEAIGQLAGGIAHDFNNILQAIMGYSNILVERLSGDEENYEYAVEIARSADRAAGLTRQLLMFSRRQVLSRQDVDLNLVIENLLKMLRRVIGEHIRLEWIPGHHLGAVHADAGMLEQMLMNLAVNARDAMPHGGVLIIETKNVFIDADYCAGHVWAVPGRYAMISVTDNGCGMDKYTLEHLFEPFFTTKEKGKGTGLGLATVYGIVKQHEGMVHVYSELDKGSTFKVYLPLSMRKITVVEPIARKSPAGGHETILLAEDDEMVRDLAGRILRRAGYTILEARNGEEAVSLYKEKAEEIDLLLFDVVMPILSGYDAYEIINAINPKVPILFSSGYSESAVHTDFVLRDGLTLIQKPYAPDNLLHKIREILQAQALKKGGGEALMTRGSARET